MITWSSFGQLTKTDKTLRARDTQRSGAETKGNLTGDSRERREGSRPTNVAAPETGGAPTELSRRSVQS